MSLFKFTALPLEVASLVAQQVAKNYGVDLIHLDSVVIIPNERESKLKELSLLSSAFRLSAQATLFRRIKVVQYSKLARLLSCIGLNPKLGFLVKESAFSAGMGLDSVLGISEILGVCPYVIRVWVSSRQVISFEIFASGKNLKTLTLQNTSIKYPNIAPVFQNLTSLHLLSTPLPNLEYISAESFPSLVNLSLHEVETGLLFHPLFSQIENFSVYQSDVEGWMQVAGVMEKFTSLKCISFLWHDQNMTALTESISRIPSSIIAIRFNDYYIDEFDWDQFNNYILADRFDSIHKLKLILMLKNKPPKDIDFENTLRWMNENQILEKV